MCSDEAEIERCIGVLDEILDLYDTDDDADEAEFYPSDDLVGPDTTPPHPLPLRSFAKIAGRNLEVRKSVTAGLTALNHVSVCRPLQPCIPDFIAFCARLPLCPTL